MHKDTQRPRILGFGQPLIAVWLRLQGVFRGLADARTPLLASLTSNILNVILAPILIFYLGWGVRGAAAAIVMAQVCMS